ncbi:MAG: OprO/OprP family phosphate-selective porin [Betaproteobacteria bacterium]
MAFEAKSKNGGPAPTLLMHFMLAASVVALFCGLSNPAFSADTETLIEKLHEKGVLSDEEYQEMRTEARAERRAQALREANEAEKAAKKAESAPSELNGRFKDGFSWESGDKQHSISLSGRIHADYRSFDIDSTNANTADTFDIRRAYLGVSGKLYNDWTFEVTSDVANSTLEYAYVNYKASDTVQLRVGAFKMPFSFEELTSSRFIDFQERSLVNAFVPGKDQGLMIFGEPIKNTFGYAVAAMNGSGKNTDEANAVVDDKDIIVRGALNFAPMASLSDTVLHLGAGYTMGTMPGNSAPTGGIRTEGRGITFLTVNAPPGAAANSETDRERMGVEGVLAWGPLKLQTEWVKSAFENSSVAYDREIDAYYGALTWLITGEKYADFYTLNGMRAIVPNKLFKKGAEGMGAWELGVRYSKIDAGELTGAQFTGTNGAEAITVGLKWVPVTPVRFYLNYTQTDFDTPIAVTGGTTDSEKAITLRAGVFF